MRAMVQISYCPPEVIVSLEIAKPSPRNKEILIRIQAAKVGPSDCAFHKGDSLMIKLIYGMFRPKFAIGGSKLAGQVKALGKEVNHFKAADRVLGMSVKNFGAYAEY